MTDYAADMSILLFRDKCMDDWNDERKISRRAAAGMFSRSYRKIQQQYPEKCSVVRTQLEKLHEMEQNHESNPEIPAGCFGTMLGELFVWKDDIWADTLRQVGFYLGKFMAMKLMLSWLQSSPQWLRWLESLPLAKYQSL